MLSHSNFTNGRCAHSLRTSPRALVQTKNRTNFHSFQPQASVCKVFNVGQVSGARSWQPCKCYPRRHRSRVW